MLSRLTKRSRKSLAWFRGTARVKVEFPIRKALHKPLADLTYYQRRVPFIERWEYSQNGEDGIIEVIFGTIGTTNTFCVEFGVEDGMQCNSRYLLKHKGWTGLLMDGQDPLPGSTVQKEFITAENINDLFRKHGVPPEFDLLSIDIDGNDYWVWKAINGFKPRVVIMEYNACLPWEASKTIPYRPDFQWDKTDYYGASLMALVKLGKEKGYTLLCTDRNGVNAFFIRDDLAKYFVIHPPEDLYRPASFKGIPGKKHPPDPKNRPWVEI